MTIPLPAFPLSLQSPAGLNVAINANASIGRMDYRDITVNLFPGTSLEGGPANIYLRRRDTGGVTLTPLLGPDSPARIQSDGGGLTLAGEWCGIRFSASWVLATTTPAWFWHIRLENSGSEGVTVDLIYAQDLAIAPYGAIRQNEYYVSQYLDHTPLLHPQQGLVVATRQNQAVGGRYPWCVIGSLGKGVAFATDALDIHGYAGRIGNSPTGVVAGLPGIRLQHEHAMVGVQDEPVRLAPGQATARGFFGWLEDHHPAATAEADRVFVDRALALPERLPPATSPALPVLPKAVSLFSTAALLAAQPLGEADLSRYFGTGRREEEREAGDVLSFFTGQRRHVVLTAKELTVLRPHGHILRSGNTLEPDEAGLTSTVWMGGTFHSMVTQGHVSINRFLSTTHSYLGLFRSQGLRVFVATATGWQLLAIPSAFEMAPESCRWLYQYADGVIEVRSSAGTDCHELRLNLRIMEGEPVRLLMSCHVALNGDDGAVAEPVVHQQDGQAIWVGTRADSDVGRRFPVGGFRLDFSDDTPIGRVGGDELLYVDGQSRQQPYLCILTEPTLTAELVITGHLVEAVPLPKKSADDYWREVTAGLTLAADAPKCLQRVVEMMPWLAHNALIHYLAPRGLEQYSGGGWGTRDVTQGPVELLLAVGRRAPIRDLLLRVFSHQNADGDWPQWFMFFDRERNIRPADSHGDIVFWPLLALAQYLDASGDDELLDEPVPFFHDEPAAGATATVWQHVERAFDLINSRLIAGTRLAAYGHGDWNDSLQPANPAMRERLCSAWTVTLHYQVLTTLAGTLAGFGQCERAAGFRLMADEVLADFRQHLLVDGVVTGYAYFEDEGRIDYLIHPRDRRTGLSYSLLPMMHAVINDMLSPEDARQQLALIRQHLHGPDGAHLFDRPMAYQGGPMTIFQRAESSSFFGREIGIMYTHAHLRYAEALWHYGDAEGFFAALGQAIPIGLQALIAPATRRQANCYYSSSDAAFSDRYRAYTDYALALKGEIALEGGWRVYSSGAGIAISLILRCLLGIRQAGDRLVIDPVLPPSLDGLTVNMDIADHPFDIRYYTGSTGHGPVSLTFNDLPLDFVRLPNPYRSGAAEVPMAELAGRWLTSGNVLTVSLG